MHAIVSVVLQAKGVNQHNYFVHHDGRYWAMWSNGPGHEEKVGQVVKYATSPDAVTWSQPQLLTSYPRGAEPGTRHYGKRTAKGLRWVARGFLRRHIDYPHVMEHDGHLIVAFATLKATVEVLGFPLEEIDRL